MTAVVVSDKRQLVPNAGIKEIVYLSSSACATGHTMDLTGDFTTIYGTYINDSTGVVKAATFSSLTVTIGTVSTGVHCIRVWGI